MKKISTAVLISLIVSFIGLVIGLLLDELFDGTDAFIFTIILPIVFVVISMGAFILHSIENKIWYLIKREHRYSSWFGLFWCCIILLTRSNKMLLDILLELNYTLIVNCTNTLRLQLKRRNINEKDIKNIIYSKLYLLLLLSDNVH